MLIGKTNPNPLLDTSEYEVQFEDGSVERYHANVIAENIYARVDSEGNTQYMLDEIIDHKSDDTALKQSEGSVLPLAREERRSPSKPQEVGSCWYNSRIRAPSG